MVTGKLLLQDKNVFFNRGRSEGKILLRVYQFYLDKGKHLYSGGEATTMLILFITIDGVFK